MILGLGIDIIEIERIARSLERHSDALLERLLTEREREFASSRKGKALAAHVAGRFAAKEAALKALGSGLADGIRWHDVEIVAVALHSPPVLELHGLAAEIAQRRGMVRHHVSISHGETAATAVVVLESKG